MNDDENDGVIVADFGSARIDLKKRTFNECRHTRVIVDPRLRRVECRDCGETLDPVEVLLQYANKERQFHYRREALDKMQERVRELATEEKRIKSRIMYAERKAAR